MKEEQEQEEECKFAESKNLIQPFSDMEIKNSLQTRTRSFNYSTNKKMMKPLNPLSSDQDVSPRFCYHLKYVKSIL